jgi:ADP-ribose pyrophosphatase YjhB (NUDIX family)
MVWTPRVTVAAVIERKGRFLLVEEVIDGEIRFNQPAGHLESGESLTEAVRREMMEETAHPFEPTALVGVYQYELPHKQRTYVRFCFTGQVGEPLARDLDEEILAVHWLTLEEIEKRREQLRSPMVLQCIRDYLAGRRLPLEILHHLRAVG